MRRSVFFVLLMMLAKGELRSQSALPAVVPAGRPAVGVALEGGGALGLAHIGVLEWMEEHHIPVDRLAGTSMGSLVGGIYASGTSPQKMREIAESDAFTRVFTMQVSYADSSFRRREDRRALPQSFTVGLKSKYGFRNALLSDRGVNEFLAINLPTTNRNVLDYNQLPIPFRCVATDLNSLDGIAFRSGPLPRAIRASISIPGVFPPVEDGQGHVLVDGGIVDNLPTDLLVSELQAKVIIAIKLEDAPLSDADTGSIVGVLNRAFSAGIARNVAAAEKLATVVVRVPVRDYSGTDYDKAKELIAVGYKAAAAHREQLERYALDDAGWQAYMADRESRKLPAPGVLEKVKIEGGNSDARQQVMADLKPLHGQVLTPAPTIDALKWVQSNGTYRATWESLGEGRGPDGGLLVHLHKDEIGPPYLLVSPEFAASTSNISRGELMLRMVAQDWGGYGSEFRADMQVGYKSLLGAEYYKRLNQKGYFVEPEGRLSREPVYIWSGQKRVAERLLESMTAGVSVGRTFSKHVQLAANWQVTDTRWSLVMGDGGGRYLNGTEQKGMLRLDVDQAQASVVSPSGFRFSAAVGELYHTVGTGNAPLGELQFSASHTVASKYILGISGEGNTSFRRNLAEPYRFTMGGPLHFSAASFDEYRATDDYLARLGLMRRIAALPTGLGQGLYATVAYEATELWQPESRTFLRQDGVAGVVANTPLGLVTFGTAIGDAGHRKVFITLGHWF